MVRAAAPALALALLLAGPAVAGAPDAPAAAVLACTGVTDAVDRLACYDRTVPALRDAGRGEGASSADDLGAERLARPDADGQDAAPRTLTARVAALRSTPTGRLRIDLDNGHVWVQTETVRLPLKEGDTVTIEPGVLGSYNLRTPRTPRLFKVERVG